MKTFSKLDKCNICKDVYTSNNIEVMDDIKVYACNECLDKAKHNFIWLCMSCGRSYFRDKDLVISRNKDENYKKALMECRDLIMIQGIDFCFICERKNAR